MRDTVQFTLKTTGNPSGKVWEGVFTAKTSLSYAEMFRQDEVRRSLLGSDPLNASAAMSDFAGIAANLALHIEHATAPEWYKQSAYCTTGPVGRDSNVMMDLAKAMWDAIKAETDAEVKKAEAAQPELKKAAEEQR